MSELHTGIVIPLGQPSLDGGEVLQRRLQRVGDAAQRVGDGHDGHEDDDDADESEERRHAVWRVMRNVPAPWPRRHLTPKFSCEQSITIAA